MSGKDELGLLPKQRLFAEFYLKGMTATAAYREAGYRNTYPERAAYKLLKHPAVQAHMKSQREKLAEACGIDQAAVINYLIRVILTPITRAMDGEEELLQYKRFKPLKNGQVQFRVRMVDKMEAVKKLTSMMGWDQPEKEVGVLDALAEIVRKQRMKGWEKVRRESPGNAE